MELFNNEGRQESRVQLHPDDSQLRVQMLVRLEAVSRGFRAFEGETVRQMGWQNRGEKAASVGSSRCVGANDDDALIEWSFAKTTSRPRESPADVSRLRTRQELDRSRRERVAAAFRSTYLQIPGPGH